MAAVRVPAAGHQIAPGHGQLAAAHGDRALAEIEGQHILGLINPPESTIEREADVVLRAQMPPGQTAQGPAAITEDETTIILPASRRAICQPDGCIDITVKG